MTVRKTNTPPHGQMTALAEYYQTQRQTVMEMRRANKLGAHLARNFHKNGTVEILGKLRALLESMEAELNRDESLDLEFQSHLQDWEILNEEARSSIDAMIDSECEAIRQ